MELYHGSNISVEKPKIIQSERALDFGEGFYLTSDFEQAKKWAILMTNRRKTGKAIVSTYEIQDQRLKSQMRILEFNHASNEWLEFISKNRKKENIENKWDIIIGPVANDNTMPVISLYLDGTINKKMAIELLLPQKLKNQYTFKNEEALKILVFKEAIEV